MDNETKMTYAIIAILVVILASVAYYLRTNSIDSAPKSNITVTPETKVVDTKKLYASTTKATTTSSTTQSGMDTKPQATTAILHTSMGDIELEFTQNRAEQTVINFLTLAATGFYNGVRFHRVIDGFMIQAGDPYSKDVSMKSLWGQGGPGYTIKDELTGTETYPEGTLAMARTMAPNSGGSQFFIVTGPQGMNLAPDYTVFGKVTKGLDVAKKIQAVPRDAADRPITDVLIKSVELK
jgi:cyclophilin family peptidyl-prolyl cis-trans isomerase